MFSVVLSWKFALPNASELISPKIMKAKRNEVFKKKVLQIF